MAPVAVDLGARSQSQVPAFYPPVQATTECRDHFYSCFEVMVAVDGADRVVTTSGYDQNLFTSDDGEKFLKMPIPAIEPANPPCAGTGDNTLQAAPDGTLFFVALRFPHHGSCAFPNMGTVPIGEGVQLAASSDGGKTWSLNSFQTVSAPATPAAYADRPWLAFGSGDEMFLVYQTAMPGGGIVISLSTDGGKSFEQRAFLPHQQFGTTRGTGLPLVGPTGRLYLPVALQDASTGANSIGLLVSDDLGKTFQLHIVADGRLDPRGLGYGLPALARTRTGVLTVAWHHETDRNVYVSRSTDGNTWTAPLSFGNSAEYPWLDAGARGTDLAILAREEEGGPCALRVYRLPENLDEDKAAVGVVVATYEDANTEAGCMTDFAHFIHRADGRITAAVPTSDFQILIVNEV